MASIFEPSRLAATLRGGLPGAMARTLAQSAGLQESSIHHLVGLWAEAFDAEAVDSAIGDAAAGDAAAGDAAAAGKRRVGQIGIVAPGNLFIATWQLAIEVLMLGGQAHVRASARDRDAIAVLTALLASLEPAWAQRVTVSHFDRHDAAAWARFVEPLQAVVAQGSDEALRALEVQIRASRPDLPMRCHGHRVSWAVATTAAIVGEDGDYADYGNQDNPGDRPTKQTQLCDSLALDALVADGRGCMTPRALFLIEPRVCAPQTVGAAPTATTASHEPSTAAALTRDVVARVGAALAEALVRAAERLPAAEIGMQPAAMRRAWVEEQRFAAAMAGQPVFVKICREYGLIVLGGPAPAALSARDLGPGGRLLVVRAAPVRPEAYDSLCAITSTIGLSKDVDPTLAEAFKRNGARRCCAVGDMQAPPWSLTSDGQPLGFGINGSSSA